MSNMQLVGKRLQMETKSGRPRGYATYEWKDVVIFDGRGTKGHLEDFRWHLKLNAPEAPPFEFPLTHDVRAFSEQGGGLIFNNKWLRAGQLIGIHEMKPKPWNHGKYLAGLVISESKGIEAEYWVLMSEIRLPPEPID